ncbi:MAG: hypothetical protein KDK10_05585 [Maritimibacter sp.]|nr:hypothetical protein [Maritimibacter sp.]
MLQRLLIGVVSVLPALAATAETGSAALAATSEAVGMLDGAVWSGPVSTPGHPLYDLRIEVVGGELKADNPDLDCGGI